MQVQKRDGVMVPVSFDAILDRIRPLCNGLADLIDPAAVTQKVLQFQVIAFDLQASIQRCEIIFNQLAQKFIF